MAGSNGKNLDDPAITDGLDMAYRIGWPGYLGPVVRWCGWGLFMLVISSFIPSLFLILLPVWIGGLIIRVLRLRSVRVYANKEGVWRYYGLFPWEKSIAGARWHNVDEATTKTGLLSWFTGCYPVFVTQRFTGRLEIALNYVHHGDSFAHRVNRLVGDLNAPKQVIKPITRGNYTTVGTRVLPSIEE